MDEVTHCEYCGALLTPESKHNCGGASVFEQPVFLWEVVIGGEMGILCKFVTPIPNRFQRFMYKLLLGWEIKIL